MPETSRYRYRSTDHYRDTVDTRYQRVWDIESGSVIINRTRQFPLEQWYYSPDQFCVDTVGFRNKDNPLSLSLSQGVPPLINYVAEHTHDQEVGGIPNGYRQRDRRTYQGWGTLAHAVRQSEQSESDVEFVTRAIAGLNPSRSNFQAAVFLAELRDLPSLIKDVGDELAEQGFIRGSGGNYLKGQYGWRPLIRDLKTFLNVADKVRNRVRTLKELRGKGKIRRRFSEKDDRGMRTPERRVVNTRLGGEHYIGVHPTDEHIIWYDASTEMLTTRWCDVEFVLDTPDNLFDPLDSELWDEAHSLVYGTTIDGPSLWQAMPWSWLIDWGTNMSEYISSQNNVVGAKFSKAVLMKTTQRVTTIQPVMDEFPSSLNGGFGFSFLPGRLVETTKERILDIQPGAVSTAEAILTDNFRTSILTGLTAQRFRPSGRVRF